MASRAVWRARPDDPRTSLGWTLRDHRTGLLPLWLAFAIMAALGAAAVWTPWALLMVPTVLFNVRRKHAPADLSLYRTVPAPGPDFECFLKVERGSENAVTGMDEGIVTFVDGWLHYAGLRTEFSLNAGDVRGLGESFFGPRMLLGDSTIELVATDPAARGAFGQATKVWYRSSVAEGDASVLPPRGVHASGVARAWVELARTLAASLAWAFAFLLAFRLLLGDPASWAVGVMASFGFGGAFGRLRAVRRLVQEERRALANERRDAIGP